MAFLNKNAFGSDDEDDLESLRLAALKSLKPKSNNGNLFKSTDINHTRSQNVYKQHPTFGAAQTTRTHNRGFRNHCGRIGRNGMNLRMRGNPNLIAIKVIDENDIKESTLGSVVRTSLNTDPPKLILPQDRYYKTQTSDISKPKENSSNKFNRYANSSDESDSDSDEQNLKPAKRERKNSLEALIDDIDNILEGKDDYQTKIDEKKSENKDKINTETINSPISVESDNDLKIDESPKEAGDTLIIEDIDSDIVQIIQNEEEMLPLNEETNAKQTELSNSRSNSPLVETVYNPVIDVIASRSANSRSKSPYNKMKSPYRSPPKRSHSRSPIRKRYSPVPYSRPLSPLSLNTDILNKITMAPLSPRSAAFVLENRQILARRQMSPRRSRSPVRRSSSPKRMKLSPRRRSRSRSRSLRFDPVRKCSLSPRRRSNSPKFSPKRRSTSPRNYFRRSPNFNRYKYRNSDVPSVKQSVYKRLGTKNPSVHDRKPELATKRKRTSRSITLSLSPSPDRNYHKRPLNETTGLMNESKRTMDKNRKDCPNSNQKLVQEDKPLDSILLARKKKFESPVQLGKNNGVIKLNATKSHVDTVNEEVIEENYLIKESPDIQDDEFVLEECFNEGSDIEIELNPTIDDLWSDEESDNENEGRFKSKNSIKHVVPTISIRNLTEKPIPKEPLLPRDRLENTMTYRTYSDRDKTTQRSKYDNRRNRSSTLNTKISDREKRSKDKDSSIKLKTKYESRDKGDKTVIIDKLDKNKEIEEKIDNKEKSLQSSEHKVTSRSVKINSEPELVLLDSSTENTNEPEIIVETDDDVTAKDEESDLRAEISRRRAERLQKAGNIARSLPTRLLKSALQEVVPKRTASKVLNVSKGNSHAADRKVLIIKSLVSSSITKNQLANKVSKKKSGKLPIHMRLGQTSISDMFVGEGARDERKSKKSRPKRKNRQVVKV